MPMATISFNQTDLTIVGTVDKVIDIAAAEVHHALRQVGHCTKDPACCQTSGDPGCVVSSPVGLTIHGYGSLETQHNHQVGPVVQIIQAQVRVELELLGFKKVPVALAAGVSPLTSPLGVSIAQWGRRCRAHCARGMQFQPLSMPILNEGQNHLLSCPSS